MSSSVDQLASPRAEFPPGAPGSVRYGPTPVENPALGEAFAEAPGCTPEQLDDVLDEAARAFPGWAATPLAERRERLRSCHRALLGAVDPMAELLTREQGKPLKHARAEVGLAAEWFARTAELGLAPEQLVDEADARVDVERVPYGVVAAIAPSNFPVLLAVCKIAPALLAGNTVVLKPSPDTPLSSLMMGRVLGEVLPRGTFAVVDGDVELGARLTVHPAVRMVSFTGSVGAGRAIARQAAADLKRVVLELGGNDPAVVLSGTDVSSVAPDLFTAAMTNSGQFCAAVKRIYAPRATYRRLAEALAEKARTAIVGDGLDPATEYGPLVNRAQLEWVASLVDDAVAAGADVLAGGRALDVPGHFYPPTVVTDLPPGSRLEEEEQFGPVIPVIPYDDLEQVFARVNASPYGLGCSLWGDEDRARELAGRPACGTVWINTHGALRHDVPFGGHRHSGLGVEYGAWGLNEYTQLKVHHSALRLRQADRETS
ncbi:aldehyde dehydrogenase family protein [Streptomyces sp. Je 1-369]|uniref:aldehyde dehydrogenase family protein n=1 Tax=Streptomyces sp. Je 1-369 TaxID=2966192 RepID=UPI00228692FC|nr:aldehyde dehydrogenase family protein [Streptomyces sp. Je 1-369]WAL93722.1 aldehyde dehydrogenase family protein [Streptomyces sp. Je 1-369]